MTTLDANLRRAVLAYLKRSGLSGLQFGQLALGNPEFVLGLDRGRSLTLETADRALRFMGQTPIGPTFRREVEAFLGVTGTGQAISASGPWKMPPSSRSSVRARLSG